MTPLRRRMVKDLTIRGLSENTRKSYLQSVAGLARFYGCSPDHLSARQVQDYLLHLSQERHLTWKTCNTVRHGLRFFYGVTLGRANLHLFVPCAKQPSTLPQILSREEVERLLRVSTNAKHRALLMTTYAAGLRVSEVTHLKVADIDSARMSLRIDQGKGRKDRYVPLSERLLLQLREYWRRQRPPQWLFPGSTDDHPMCRATAARAYNRAKDKAGIKKRGSIHTLRHCFGTHLLEAGTELVLIQRLMGHTSIRSTMRYLHIAHKTGEARSPLDLLEFPAPRPH